MQRLDLEIGLFVKIARCRGHSPPVSHRFARETGTRPKAELSLPLRGANPMKPIQSSRVAELDDKDGGLFADYLYGSSRIGCPWFPVRRDP